MLRVYDFPRSKFDSHYILQVFPETTQWKFWQTLRRTHADEEKSQSTAFWRVF